MNDSIFTLESRYIKRQFKILGDRFFASEIINKYSSMNFVPDGNGNEFFIKFVDGDELSSKNLSVVEAEEKNHELTFTFERKFGTTVKVCLWIGKYGRTLRKQISVIQETEKPIDYALLENIGIINSTVYYSVPEAPKSEIPKYLTTLGQPFYVDSLFFGCEFPATDNRIVHGAGQIKYYLGKQTSGEFKFPVTVIGSAKSSNIADVRKAFFNYIELNSVKSDFRLQYNSWYDHMLDIDADNIEKSFFEIEKQLSSHGVSPIDAYVVDDGWNDYKSDFWSFNGKFPNGLIDCTRITSILGSKFGLWLGPRGGYNFNKRFAKRIEKAGMGFYNSESEDICVASEKYIKNLEQFFIENTQGYDIDYWKLDGFMLTPCKNDSHDHITGGENEMYMITEMWERWIELLKNLRKSRLIDDKDLWINMTCYVNPSPWWLQYVNSFWIQNSNDIGFAKNYDLQPQVESEITYRDARYYDFTTTRGIQFPLKNIYNHEPIYGNTAKVKYSDEEFEKYIFWCAVRGQALNELHLSYSMMNEAKWTSLAKALKWQKANYSILKNAQYLGGNPENNNVYGYTSWDDNGNGIVALRNPSKEKVSLTITLNKLMGAPEELADVHRYNVYNKSTPETSDTFSYADKIDLVLDKFEVKIFQFGKEDNRFNYVDSAQDFTIFFDSDGDYDPVCVNDDIKIVVSDGYINVDVASKHYRSSSKISHGNHKIAVVREKNMAVKIYIDKRLDSTHFDADSKPELNLSLTSVTENFKVLPKAAPYNELIELDRVLGKSGARLFKRK